MSDVGQRSRVGRRDALIALAMLTLGAFAWIVDLARPTWIVDAQALAHLPLQMGDWRGRDIPLAGTVEEILDADFHVQRLYETGREPPVMLYVGYYGTTRGGRPEHTPRGCYVGAGWGIERSESVAFDPSDPSSSATEYLVERRGARQLVLYWYRSYRRTGMTDGLMLSWDRLAGRLTSGRSDGALIRLATPLLSPSDDARKRLTAFAQHLDPLLGDHWPREMKDTATAASPPSETWSPTLRSERDVHPHSDDRKDPRHSNV